MFWTVAIPPESVQADPSAGTASYRLSDFAVKDAFTIPNAISGDKPPVSSTVSFDIRFSGVTKRAAAATRSSDSRWTMWR